MSPKNSTEQDQIANAPVVESEEDKKWREFLEGLEPFAREQVELATDIQEAYGELVQKREANRELLRYLVKMNKVPESVVNDLYPPKNITRPRRRKGETPAEYKARTGVDLEAQG